MSNKNSVPDFKINNTIAMKTIEQAKEVPEFKIILNKNDQSVKSKPIDDRSLPKIDTVHSQRSVTKSTFTKAISRNNADSTKRVNTLTAPEFKIKNRAKSVSRFSNSRKNSEQGEIQIPSKSRWPGSIAATSMINEKIDTNVNYLLNKTKNTNFGNSMKVNYNKKESLVEHKGLSENPVKMVIRETQLKEKFREEDDYTEPMTPIKFSEMQAKEGYRMHNHNIMNFLTKQTEKSKKVEKPAAKLKKSLKRKKKHHVQSMPFINPASKNIPKNSPKVPNQKAFKLAPIEKKKKVKMHRLSQSPQKDTFLQRQMMKVNQGVNLTHRNENGNSMVRHNTTLHQHTYLWLNYSSLIYYM